MVKVQCQWVRDPSCDVRSGGGYDYDKDARLRATGSYPEGEAIAECWIAELCWRETQHGWEQWLPEGKTPPAEMVVCGGAHRKLLRAQTRRGAQH